MSYQLVLRDRSITVRRIQEDFGPRIQWWRSTITDPWMERVEPMHENLHYATWGVLYEEGAEMDENGAGLIFEGYPDGPVTFTGKGMSSRVVMRELTEKYGEMIDEDHPDFDKVVGIPEDY